LLTFLSGLKDYLKTIPLYKSIPTTNLPLNSSVANAIVNRVIESEKAEDKPIKENSKITEESNPIPKEHSYYANLSELHRRVLDETAKAMMDLDGSPGWQLLSNQQNIEITKKDVGSNMSCARGVGKIHAPPLAIVNFIKDFDRRGEWDLMLVT
jgi:hypothetical protein